MSGRTEMSTTLPDPNLELASPKTALIALIGPNAAHRSVMAKALTGSEARTVREFIDYPANLADIPQMMEENFDVVMIDVDSDQSYALQIVETIAAFNTAIVMVYSMRNDPELLRECMRAGARDFLPLPEDCSEAPAAAEAPEVPVALPEDLESINPADFLLAEPVNAPISPEAQTAQPASESEPYSAPSYNYSASPRRPDLQPFSQSAASRQPELEPQLRPEDPLLSKAPSQPEEAPVFQSPSNDFSAWDSLWIRSAHSSGAKSSDVGSSSPTAAEPAPKKKSGPVAIQSGPQLVAHTSLPDESAVPAPTLFRQVHSDDTVQSHRPWVRWVLFAGVPLVIIGLLMLVFMPSSRPSAPAASQAQSDSAQAERSATDAATAPATSRLTAKPSAGSVSSGLQAGDAPAQTTPVSSDMMNAQLSAPSRISGDMKKPAPVEEPPAGFMPSAIESGDVIPGQVFAGQIKLKVVPSVSAISAGVAEGMLLHKTAPAYPEFAKAAHVSGTVLLGASITKTGTIAGLHVISGPAVLRAPAADAVKTWHYRPYMLNNQPVEVQTTIKVVFTLDQH
jgi:CheY-like chemotaxis protein